jgi:hypothetical protein
MAEAPAAATGETQGIEPRRRLARWAEEGQQMLPTIPGVFAEIDRLKARAEVAEQECERLRRELTQVGEALGRVVSNTVESLTGTLARLREP